MTDTPAQTNNGAAWEFFTRRRWIVVPADAVMVGDVYANGASVTASRPADPKVDAFEQGREWTIECGPHWKLGTRASSPVVVGRECP